MYGNIYHPRSACKLSNSKFITPSALVYDAPPNEVQYQNDTLSTRQNYSYGQSAVMNDDNVFRLNVFSGKDAPVPSKPVVTETKEDYSADTCGSDETSICGAGRLFPILDPRFNLREAAKNMILLEDHLFHEGKRCKDCILKHCLTIEGFLEEGVTLDTKREYTEILQSSLSEFRQVFSDLANLVKTNRLTDEDCCAFAQRIRLIRKPLCQKYATFLKT